MDKEIVQIYEKFHSNNLTYGLMGIAYFIAAVIIGVKVYEEYKKIDEKGWKVLIGIMKQFISMIAFIAVFPYILNQLEIILGAAQVNISNSFNASVDMSVDEFASKMIDEYTEKTTARNNSVVGQVLKAVPGSEILTVLEDINSYIGITLSTFALTISKYLYFICIASRYLWLLMLEIIAPIAITCSMHKSTQNYFKSWLKNMMICYLLIPFFLLADVFAELIIKAFADTSALFGYNSFGLLAILATIALKIYLYKVAANKSNKLID